MDGREKKNVICNDEKKNDTQPKYNLRKLMQITAWKLRKLIIYFR